MNLIKELDEQTLGDVHSSAWAGNRSSALGWLFECPRYIEIARIDHRKLPPVDLSLQRIFNEGNKQEHIIKQDLARLGYTIEVPDKDQKWEHLQITGRIDGIITKRYGNYLSEKPILEIKSASPNNFRGIEQCTSMDDLRTARNWWYRNVFAQMQGYLLIYSSDYGVILWKDKSTGRYHQINMKIDWDFCNRMVELLGPVNENVAKKKPRPAVRCEACSRCELASTECFVGKDFGPGWEILTDAELEKMCERREELKVAVDEYKELDTILKARFAGNTTIVGPWKASSKEIFKVAYEIPEDIKQKYKTEFSYWKTKIERM